MSDFNNTIKELENEIDKINDAELSKYRIYERTPKAGFAPKNYEEISKIIKESNKNGLKIVGSGGATKLGFGNIPTGYDIIVSSSKFNNIIEYVPEELTISVQSGITISSLQEIVNAKNQFIPIDSIFPNATLGGIIATNTNGILRTSYGSLRDLVLGIKAVDGNGKIVKAGGKVVKNVAGYDLSKVFIGSLGTLGIITEINMRTYPLPEYESTLIIQSNNLDKLRDIVEDIQKYSYPGGLELINSNFGEQLINSEYEWNLLIRYLGHKNSINEQTSKDKKILKNPDGEIQEIEGIDSRELWKRYHNILADTYETVIKIMVPITTSTNILKSLNTLQKYSPLIYCESSLGIIHMQIDSKDEDFGSSEITNMRNEIEKNDGMVIIENTTSTIKKEINSWSNYNNNINIMNQIKNAFDKNNVLSPGRFLGGI